MSLQTTLSIPTCTIPGTVYLAPRKERRTGDGTLADPFNVNNFTGSLVAAWDWAVKNGKRLVFLPGDYTVATSLKVTKGIYGLHVSGYGARFRWAGPVAGERQENVFWTLSDCNDSTWEGFEIDLSGATRLQDGRGSTKLSGMAIWGRNVTIRDVTVRGLWVDWVEGSSQEESFGIALIGRGGCDVHGCKVLGLAPGQSKGLYFGICVDGPDNRVFNNFVDLGETDPQSPRQTAGIGAFCERSKFHDNMTRGVRFGFSADIGPYPAGKQWNDNQLSGNNWFGSVAAVRISPSIHGYNGWTWTGDVFDSPSRWVEFWNYSAELTPDNGINNHVFQSCRFVGEPTTNIALNHGWLMFRNNIFDFKPNVNGNGTFAPLHHVAGVHNMVYGGLNDSAFEV